MGTYFYFEIQADNIQRAASFYKKLFEWKFERVEGLPVEYWNIHTDGIFGGLLQRPTQTPPPGYGANAFVNSIQVEDFDGTARKILELNGEIALPKFAVPGKCWQGYFLDTEGNTFGLFEVDESAK